MIRGAALFVVALTGCDTIFGLDVRPAELDAPILDGAPPDAPRVCAFMPPVSFSVSLLVGSIAAADLLGDDSIDLVVTNTNDGTILDLVTATAGEETLTILAGDGSG